MQRPEWRENRAYVGSCGVLGVPVQVEVIRGVRAVGRGQVRGGDGFLQASPQSGGLDFLAAALPAGLMGRACQQGRSIFTRLGHKHGLIFPGLIFPTDKKSQLCPLLDQRAFCTSLCSVRA